MSLQVYLVFLEHFYNCSKGSEMEHLLKAQVLNNTRDFSTDFKIIKTICNFRYFNKVFDEGDLVS
jgi:hypothetical protein